MKFCLDCSSILKDGRSDEERREAVEHLTDVLIGTQIALALRHPGWLPLNHSGFVSDLMKWE